MNLGGSDGRTVEISDKRYLNFAGNDYLGISKDPGSIESGIEYARKYGSGSCSSRLITGDFSCFKEIEDEIAEWIGMESALVFNSGYHANIGLISALAGSDTVIFCDQLVHASIYDGIFVSGAILKRYRHNDIASLDRLLNEYKDSPNKIIVTESLFSMEGDLAPLTGISDLAMRHGCFLIVDEAHSLGLFGPKGNGVLNMLEIIDNVDAVVGTFGKSFGAFGAFVAGKKILREFLINTSRPFIFSTSLPPFVAGCVKYALKVIKSGERSQRVLKTAELLRNSLKELGADTGNSVSQLIPVITGSNRCALDLMKNLKHDGIYAPAIRPPSVPPKSSRIRLAVSYLHEEKDIEKLLCAVKRGMERCIRPSTS